MRPDTPLPAASAKNLFSYTHAVAIAGPAVPERTNDGA